MASITDRYDNNATFISLLTRIGIPTRERNKLVNDGFTTLKLLVNQYSADISELTKYLKDLNETFGSSTTTLRVNFTPFLISRIIGLTFYYTFCVKSLHTIPDPDLVDTDNVVNYYMFYNHEFKMMKENEDDEETSLKIPELIDHHKWLKFRDALTEKLSHTIGDRNIPITYVIDSTIRPVTSANTPLIESAELIDISNTSMYETDVIQFGPAFRKDSKIV